MPWSHPLARCAVNHILEAWATGGGQSQVWLAFYSASEPGAQPAPEVPQRLQVWALKPPPADGAAAPHRCCERTLRALVLPFGTAFTDLIAHIHCATPLSHVACRWEAGQRLAGPPALCNHATPPHIHFTPNFALRRSTKSYSEAKESGKGSPARVRAGEPSAGVGNSNHCGVAVGGPPARSTGVVLCWAPTVQRAPVVWAGEEACKHGQIQRRQQRGGDSRVFQPPSLPLFVFRSNSQRGRAHASCEKDRTH